MSDREGLYRNWVDWAMTNLGRDARLAEIAATAAANATELGRGFNNAEEAARAAWADAAQRYSRDHRWWWDGQQWTPASLAVPRPAQEVRAPAGGGWQRKSRAPSDANRGRSLFYASVAVVIGILVVYPISGATTSRFGLLAPLVVSLVAGFALGGFSRSWRLAILCAWFIASLGFFGVLFVAFVTFAVPWYGGPGPSLDMALALLLGGLGGAAAGGYLGAKVRGAN